MEKHITIIQTSKNAEKEQKVSVINNEDGRLER